MQLFRKFFLNQPALVQSVVPVLNLLYRQLPRFAILPHLRQAGWADGSYVLDIEKDWTTDELLLAKLSFGEHAVELAGLPTPLPRISLERTVMHAHWANELKAQAIGHQANLILSYAGASRDAIAQYQALYHVAQLFAAGCVGVVNEPAWNYHPAQLIVKLNEPELIAVARESPPLIFWTGFMKLDADGALWYLTRGNHLFGVPDFALHHTLHEVAVNVQELFADCFHYYYFENKDLQPGDVVQIEGKGIYEFMDGKDLLELFGGMGDILVVRPTTADEMQQLADAEGGLA